MTHERPALAVIRATVQPTSSVLARLLAATLATEAALRASAARAERPELRGALLERWRVFARASCGLVALAGAWHGRVLVGVSGRLLAHVDARRAGACLPSDDRALLAECRRREDEALVAYRDALEQALPDLAARALVAQFAALLDGCGALAAAAGEARVPRPRGERRSATAASRLAARRRRRRALLAAFEPDAAASAPAFTHKRRTS